MGRHPKPYNDLGIQLDAPPPYLFAMVYPFALSYSDESSNWYNDRFAEANQILEPLREQTRQIQSAQQRLDLQTYVQGSIGQIRAIYFRELVLESHYYTLMSKIGYANTSFFCHNRKFRSPSNWLIHDLFLNSFLRTIGISFSDVEAQILKTFWKTPLPKRFRHTYENDPHTQSLLLWHTLWTERIRTQDAKERVVVKRGGKKYLKHQELLPELETIIQTPIEQLEHHGTLSFDEYGNTIVGAKTERDRLLNEALFQNLPEGFKLEDRTNRSVVTGKQLWEMGILKIRWDKINLSTPDDEEFPEYKTIARSPFINRMIFGLIRYIWQFVDTNLTPDSEVAQYLIKRKKAWEEAGADTENTGRFIPSLLYLLVADILYHLPVVQGLPDTHRLSEATHPQRKVSLYVSHWEGLTAEEIRQRFGTEKKRRKRSGTYRTDGMRRI